MKPNKQSNKRILFITQLEIWSMSMKASGSATMGNQSMYNTILGYARHGYKVHLLTCSSQLTRKVSLPENIILHRHPIPGRRLWQNGRIALRNLRKRLFGNRENKSDSAAEAASSAVTTDIGYKRLRRATLTLCFYVVLTFWAFLLSLRYRFLFFYGYEIYGTPIAKLMGKLFHRPTISRFQGTLLSRYLDEPEKIRYNWPHWWAMQMKTELIIMTDDGTQGDRVLEHLGVTKDRYVFWRNGVAFENVDQSFDASRFRAERGIDEGTLLFTSASRMVYWKRIERMIHAVALVPENRRFTLVLIGDGALREPLESLVQKLNLTGRIEFTGAIPHREVIQWHTAADVLISTFDVSNVGNQLLEAQRLGKPYISVDTGDTCRILADDVNGLLMKDPDDHSAIAGAMTRMIDEPDLRKRLGRGAVEVGKNQVFTWEQRADKEVAEVEMRLDLNYD